VIQNDLSLEQRKDPKFKSIIIYKEEGLLPQDQKEAQRIVTVATNLVILDNVLYFVDNKRAGRRRAAVPSHLRSQIMEQYHGGRMSGHFSGSRLYATLCYSWWWENMYTDAVNFASKCAECCIVNGTGNKKKPPLHPIPVQRPFQIIGIDIMELPRTAKGNRYVVVMQDFLTKWPLVFPVPDQKADRLARLIVDELLPLFGVPEALLSDRGANLLAHVMQDVCALLGIHKLNTTAYHPQCDGMVERLNRTLKGMLRKHAARFGPQWDRYLSGVLWAYRNTPHESTREKPSFLLFGYDCRSPTEAAYLPTESIEYTDISDYQEELVLSLSSARELAASNIKAAQKCYKRQYDKHAASSQYRVGDLVLIRFPHEETGKQRKLSRPWHGPYRIVECRNPDLVVKKQFFPEEGTIQVHQLRACPCPQLPVGFYWYGGNRLSTGSVPRWVERLLQRGETQGTNEATVSSRAQSAASEDEVDNSSDNQLLNSSDSQLLDDVNDDDQETDDNNDDQLSVQPESPGNVSQGVDLLTPRYNLRAPSARRPPSKYK